MPKKHYCQNCQNPIEEGKEIKVKKGSNYHYSRYSSYPRDYYVYYLCPRCYQQQHEERAVIFLVYQRQQDKKTDRITKKSQKVKKN
ncbi:15641_t:CDS:2 [Funneliformis geosporum]|uniref:15641_t:CDS:1 n=1 Tax=Funneliformis geosporum TaxID=1117311 RepID=A0A9W4SXV7_9GLOM|nr:15641_t:CDS:2 [Funneliformis geosporum]